MSKDPKKNTLSEQFAHKASSHALPVAPEQRELEACQVLQGDLSQKPIAWLLRAAQHFEVTGVLLVGSAACSVSVQFGLGRAVHAHHPLCAGAEAIMDLFIWEDGRVRFEPGKLPQSASIQETTEELLIRGEAYLDNLEFLGEHGINEMSFLMRPSERLAEGELMQRLSLGRKISFDVQCEFYSNIYGTRNLKDAAEKLNLPPSQWVSIAANLLQLGLLLNPAGDSLQLAKYSLVPRPAPQAPPDPETSTRAADQGVPVETKVDLSNIPANMVVLGVPDQIIELDPTRRDSILQLLRRPETGILSFDALNFFLEREFARAYRLRAIFSLVLFCARLNQSQYQLVPLDVSVAMTTAVSRIVHDQGIFGHFGDRAFAIVLPDMSRNQACALADKICGDLPYITPELGPYKPLLHFGIGCVPSDATDLPSLVHATQSALFDAAARRVVRV